MRKAVAVKTVKRVRPTKVPAAKEEPVVLPLVEAVEPGTTKSLSLKDPDSIYEPKMDGYRALLHCNGQRGYFRSKKGSVLVGKFRYQRPAENLCKLLGQESVIMDGELVVFDPATGLPLFKEMHAQRGRMTYVVFDLLYHNGQDLRQFPLLTRKRRLRQLLDGLRGTPEIQLIEYVHSGTDLWELVTQLDMEGIIAKKKNAAYGEQAGWKKMLNPKYTQKEGRERLFPKKPKR